MNEQATLVIIKPDGLIKSLTGNVLSRLSETKLKIMGAKVLQVSEELAIKHYTHLQDKPFFPELKKYIMGDLHGENRVMALVYWGHDAINKCRQLAGATNPEEAESTSIRGAYGRITTSGVYENVIHVSANKTDAEREIKLWLQPDEIIVELFPAKEIIKNNLKIRIWV